MLELLDLAPIELVTGTQPLHIRHGTINAVGLVTYEAETDVGRFQLVERVTDPDMKAPTGTIFYVEPANSPAVHKWNLVTYEGANRLMRCTPGEAPDKPFLRQMGREVLMQYSPKVFTIIGVVAWELHPSG